MKSDQVKRLKDLELEHQRLRLRRAVSNLTLDFYLDFGQWRTRYLA